MNIKTFLDLSTLHITERDNQILSEMAGDDAFGLFPVYPRGDHGWLVSVVSTDFGGCTPKDLAEQGFSIAFCALYELAHEQGCSAILFDLDGDIDPDLETFDW